MLSKLASPAISSLRKLDDEANKFYDRKHDLYEAAFRTRCYTQHAFRSYIDSEINHIRHFNKLPFHSLKKVLNSQIYLAYFEIIMLYQLYLHISKTWNLLLFVINITNLFVILYLISIN